MKQRNTVKGIYSRIGKWAIVVFLLSVLLVQQTAFAAPNQLDGIVFRDYNANGTQNALEPGIQNVVVTVVDGSGNSATTTTDAAGAYTISTASGLPAPLSGAVRVEYTLPASLNYLQPGAAGGTTVQFANITTGATLNVGFNNPAQYSQPDPELFTPVYIVQDNLSGPYNTNPVSGAVAYSANSNTPTINRQVPASQMGATYGVAWQPESGSLFTSSYVKYASGLGPNGSGGTTTGGIYLVSGTGATATATLFMDLQTTLGLGADPHPAPGATCTSGVRGGNDNTNCWYHDSGTFAQVGKMGLGDLDFNGDQTLLYTVDLTNRQLVEIPVGNPAVAPAPSAIQTYSIPTNACANAADARPFALAPYDDDPNKMYVGVTCTGQTSGLASDMSVQVYEFDRSGAGTFTNIFSNSLNYPRLRSIGSWGACSTPGNCPATWRPWVDTVAAMNIVLEAPGGKQIAAHPQPMLTDIAFDGPDLVLAVRDRVADMFGSALGNPTNNADTRLYDSWAAGDLLRACANGSGGWTMESNGVCGSVTGGGQNNTDGYSNGEFYLDQSVSASHSELMLGGMVQIPGFPSVAVTVYDGTGSYNSGDIATWNATGAQLTGARLYINISPNFGKANGLGDLEALRAPAPIELGNRVWNDADGDGIQDPGEAVIAGVTVTLHDMDNGGTQVGSATTDANGNYLFGGVANTNMTSGSVLRGRNYEIRINTAQGSLTGLGLTVRNSDGQTANNGLTDLRDSDASLSGTTAVIVYTTGGAGSNNHTLDFGFTTDTAADYGDLPDSFDTTIAAGGPAHSITSALYLGTCVDAETNGQPDAEAGTDGVGGDDNNVTGGVTGTCSGNDDEDGVTLITPLVAGHQACVSVTAVNTTGSSANLYGFIDYNGDGDFDGDVDNLLTGGSFGAGAASVANGGVNGAAYCFDVPASATFDGGETHLRFRLTSDTIATDIGSGDTPWGGPASDGEVEDYYNQLSCVGNYLWFDTGTTPNVQDAGDTAVPNGTIVNLIWGGPDGVIGGGDDITYSTTTSGGSYNFCGLLPNANGAGGADEYQVVVPNAPGTPVTAGVGGDVALDSDGTANGNAANGPVFTLPTANMNNDTAANDTDPNNYPDAQTDLSFDFGFQAVYDWGDLPDTGAGTGVANYNTLNSDNGARHIIAGGVFLGACVDGEADGLQNQQAGLTGAGDDGSTGSPIVGTCVGNDDEDGVTWTSVLMAGRPASFAVSTSGDSCLSVFIDFDNNGSLDAVSTNGNSPTSPSTALSDLALTGAGPHAFQIDVPGTANGVMYSRFRLTAACSEGGASATGLATSGEVEDYVLAAVGNFVWEDSNLDGLQGDADTANNNGLTVSLLDGSGAVVNDAAGNPITTVTAADGSYSFPGVLPGLNYRVGFTAPIGFGFTPRDQGSDDTVDSDANVFDGRTISFTVNPAATDDTRDAGIYQVTNHSVGNRVWVDTNNDGTLNPGELGIAGATVQLRRDTGGDGVDAADPILATFTTDSEGYYIFPNVAPNTAYFVCSSATGYGFSSGAPIGNHPPSGTEENETNGDDGTPLGTANLVCSQLFDVVANSLPTGELVTPVGYADNNADMKIDFGFSSTPTAVSLSSFSGGSSAATFLLLAVVGVLLATGSLMIVRRRR